MPFDWTLARKLPKEHRYLDIGEMGLFFFRPFVSLFHKLHFRPEVAWLLASFFALLSGFFLFCYDFLVGFILLVLKVSVDHVGNILGRVTQNLSPAAMYLSGILEFVAATFVLYSMAQAGFSFLPTLIFLALWLSVLLQHSYYSYFATHYLRCLEIESISPFNTISLSEDRVKIVGLLRWIHRTCYRWQTKTIHKLDVWMRGPSPPDGWYQQKTLLSLQSLFRRGNQYLVLCIVSLSTDISLGIVSYLIGSNLYWLCLILTQRLKAKSMQMNIPPPEQVEPFASQPTLPNRDHRLPPLP